MDEIIKDLQDIRIWCFLFGYMAGITTWLMWPTQKKKRESKYPKCDCKDVNDCHKWCNAKHLFKKDSDAGIV